MSIDSPSPRWVELVSSGFMSIKSHSVPAVRFAERQTLLRFDGDLNAAVAAVFYALYEVLLFSAPHMAQY